MHLVDIPGQERETETILRLIDTDPLIQSFFHALGLTWPLCWYVIQINQAKLVSTRRGDVDILAGNLTWHDPKQFSTYVREDAAERPDWHPTWHFDLAARKLAEEGGILWPPSTDYLVAIEVKCAYFTDTLHAAKGNQAADIRKQVTGLQKMGFDHVALLDVIANRPASGVGMDAWTAAGWQAHDSRQAMLGILQHRLEPNSEVHHFALSIGAVIGGDENLRGAGMPIPIHPGTTNYDSKNRMMVANRFGMNQNIRQLLARHPAPHFYPHVFIDCDLCGEIHQVGACQSCMATSH